MNSAPPTVLHGYKIVKKLGAGRFSEVFLVRRKRQNYALKILQPTPEMTGKDILESLRYEFWVLKDLHHPNIISPHEVGVLQDGRPYLLEEFLDGLTLDNFCRGKSFKECQKILLEILQGLHELHSWSVVHGDLKPQNILIVSPQGQSVAKILDFGLAKICSQLSLSGTGIEGASGTPATMPPETISTGTYDEKSDIYSLGVTFYTALAGYNPFVQERLAGTMASHMHEVAPRLGLTRHDVPPLWDDLIAGMLAKDPQDRPTSVGQILNILTQPESAWTRSPTGATPSSLEEICGTIKGRLLLRQMGPSDPLWAKTELLIQQISDHPQRLKQQAIFLTLKGEALIDNAKFAEAREALKSALVIFHNDVQLKVEEMSARNFLTYISLRQGKVQEAIASFEEVMGEMQTQLTAQQRARITNLELGSAYLQAGLYARAIQRLGDELMIHRNSPTTPGAKARQATTLYHLAQAYVAMKDLERAEDYYQQTLAEARNCHDPALMLRALNGLGNILSQTQRQDAAKKTYTEAWELALALGDLSAAAAARQNRGAVNAKAGLIPQARHDLEESLRLLAQVPHHYAFEKTMLARSYVELGELALAQNDTKKAQGYFERAWHVAEDSELENFRFWVLLARCRLWQQTGEKNNFEQDLARLNFYAREDAQKELVRQNFKMPPSDVATPRGVDPSATSLLAILHINHDLWGEISPQQLIAKILKYALELSQAEIGVFLQVAEDGKLTPVHSLNVALQSAIGEISLSVAKQVVSTGRVIHAHDALDDPAFNQHASVVALHLISILGLPILAHGKVVGVLYLSHRLRRGLFSQQVIRTLEVFCDQAGLALAHTQQSHRPTVPSTGPGLTSWYRPGKNWAEHEILIFASACEALDFDMPRVAASLKIGIATAYKWLAKHRLAENKSHWRKRVLPYLEGTTLAAIKHQVFACTRQRFAGKPQRAARALNIAPATFYKWSRSTG